jgi:hypothetical protein
MGRNVELLLFFLGGAGGTLPGSGAVQGPVGTISDAVWFFLGQASQGNFPGGVALGSDVDLTMVFFFLMGP